MNASMLHHAYYRTRSALLGTVIGTRSGAKVVALTFDDGPDPTSTPAILAALRRLRVPATFFMLGRNVTAHSALAAAVAGEGHAIGNHTFTHRDLGRCGPLAVARELFACRHAIRRAAGVVPTLMRPPFGFQSASSKLVARAMGYTVVHWAASGDDYRGEPTDAIAARALAGVGPGSVLLLHDGLEPPPGHCGWKPGDESLRDRRPTLEALPLIVGRLTADGYRFVTVPELLRLGAPAMAAWDTARRDGVAAAE